MNPLKRCMTAFAIATLLLAGPVFAQIAEKDYTYGIEINIERPGNNTEQWLVETVRRQAQQAGIGMPEVGIFQSPDANAFATGMRRNDALVAVSSGLLQNMNADEVEAVLGHEISHVSNGDMVTMGLMQGGVNTFVIFLSRVIGHVVDREFRADSGGASLAGRGKMIGALQALQRAHEPADLPGEFAAFGISGGLGAGVKKLFMSHPPLEERIAALRASQ